jgi:hypothetical protein
MEFVVGNCHVTIESNFDAGTVVRGPLPDEGYIGSAFCAASLPTAMMGRVQIVPRGGTNSPGGHTRGFPEFDERFLTFGSFDSALGTRLEKAMRARFPEAPDPLGPELAAFIARRGDWAFTLDGGVFVCVTLDPLRSGQEARRLVEDTAHAVSLIGL